MEYVKLIYCLRGSYKYEYDDPVVNVEKYYVFEDNAFDELENIQNECCNSLIEVVKIECTEEEYSKYYFEDDDEIE